MSLLFWIASFIFCIATTSSLSAQALEFVDRIVAVVNGEPILASDLKNIGANVAKPGFIDDTLIGAYTLNDLQSNPKAQLYYLVNEKILSSEIKKLGLSVSAERVEQEIAGMAKKAGASKEELISALKAQGVSLLEYKAFLKDKIEKQSLVQQEVISKIRISDDELMTEYLKVHQKKSSLIAEYDLAQIYFNPDKKTDKPVQERAKIAYDKIIQGLPFEAAVEQFTEDPQFENNGYLGHFKSGEFLIEIETKILAMGVGEISPPLKTKKGLHIFKLLDKKTVPDERFEKEKEKLSSVLLERAFRAQMPLWLENKRSESYITINEKQTP